MARLIPIILLIAGVLFLAGFGLRGLHLWRHGRRGTRLVLAFAVIATALILLSRVLD